MLDLAAAGRLKTPAVLAQQVRRMLKDKRSEALADNFLPQWLNLRALELLSPADSDFDDSLRGAMAREIKMFFDSIVREDRPMMDLLMANYTFVNERLASHYGIPNVKGSHFRRVMLSEDSPRRGLFGKAAILTTTSHAIRTSPVKRGKWILESIIGVAPPPPPPNVPPLEEKTSADAPPASMRERMAAHRANPACASCHSMIDPVGFALENFDQTGKWREVDASMAQIDTSGTLPNGTQFKTFTEFRAALTARPELFAMALSDRLMTYAVGRGLEYYDTPALRTITREAARQNYRFSSLILGIVNSVPFQMRRPQVAATVPVVAAVRP